MNDKPQEPQNESKETESSQPPKKDLKELLKTSRRKGYSTKGQQGLIEFDYPQKDE